ncbi:unnamed protein product [Cylicostephanus goldi]|uniref:Uncharacterized protein n=1 Tax=Cylicostephanus goldi TaxID=71465 RepID=A0A3P7MG85_CYLGO|nr:unnamed protein product [Cylicostephanus goldi]
MSEHLISYSDGRNRTLHHTYLLCHQTHADCGLARIVFDAKGDAMSEYSVEHSDTSSPTEPAVDECKENGDAPDEVNMESFREVLMNIIRETDLDITRLKNRKDMFQQLYVQYFGTGPDGSITDDGEGWCLCCIF